MAYFVAAQTIHDGQPGTRLYDDTQFAARVMQESHGAVTDIYVPNPPSLAVAWSPFAYLTVEAARHVLDSIQRAVSGCVRVADLSRTRVGTTPLGHGRHQRPLYPCPHPPASSSVTARCMPACSCLHVIAWRAYLRHRDARAGIALGVAMALKVSGWPVGLLMLVQRRWIAVCWLVATAVAAHC